MELDTDVKELFRYSKCLCENSTMLFEECKKCNKKYKKINDFFGNEYDKIIHIDTTKGYPCILNDVWLDCKEQSIGSHTISKSSHLSSLSNGINKDIYTLSKNNSYMLNNNDYTTFKKSSYESTASIFHGLCHKHDAIYYPVDKNFDYKNYQHLLLLSHRQTLYEIHKKMTLKKHFENVKSIFLKIEKKKLETKYLDLITDLILTFINQINNLDLIIENLKLDINDFKKEFYITNDKVGKAVFNDKQNFIYLVIKFEEQMNFSFSSKFAMKYSFKKELLYKDIHNLNSYFKTPTIGLINHENSSYFYCVALRNKDNINFINSLNRDLKSNINTLLKFALAVENCFYSEDFIKNIEKQKIPNSFYVGNNKNDWDFKFNTLDKLLGYLYFQDSLLLTKATDTDELLRIDNINNIDYLNILQKNAIIEPIIMKI